MKQVKVNLMVIAAITIAVMTMSFKLSEKSKAIESNWYSVGLNGQSIDPLADTNAPDLCEATTGPHCAIQLTIEPGAPFPATVNDAIDMEVKELLKINDERFRDN